MFPDDPLGRDGPNLDQFLTKEYKGLGGYVINLNCMFITGLVRINCIQLCIQYERCHSWAQGIGF